MGNDAPIPEGATIHSIVPEPVQSDDDKIGFTLDVAMRLDQEQTDEADQSGAIISIVEDAPEPLADTA
jgi:hypothetical protein